MAAVILEHPTFKKHKECQLRFKESLDYVIDKEKTKAFNILNEEFTITPKQQLLESVEPRIKVILGKMKSRFETIFPVPITYRDSLSSHTEISYHRPDPDPSILTMEEIVYVTQYCLMMGQQELMES